MDEENNQNKEEIIFSVSDYIKTLNKGLKGFKAKIIGEVSEFQISAKGHVYYSLKDEKDGSVIKCIILKYQYLSYGIELKEGLKIIALGSPSLHKQYGFSFIAETIEYAGEGTLKKEYEKLKKKLTQEGFFKEERKRPVPFFPQKIGVITSLKGAVIADFSNNLSKFGFKVKMIDSRVEGQEAVMELISSIKTFRERDIELLVIIRGGGSMESMMAFNNEILVREVVNFPVPVITGIGHHKDAPLMSLASDVSVSTPTAVANIINKSWENAVLVLKEQKENIINSYDNELEDANLLIERSLGKIRGIKDLIFNKYREIENALMISFQGFKNAIRNNKNDLIGYWDKVLFGFNSLILTVEQQLKHSEKIIYLHNPKTQLKLGYSIVSNKEGLIRSVKNAKVGEELDIFVIDGKIVSKVKKIDPVKLQKSNI